MLGVERIGVIDSVREEAGTFVASVRPSKGNRRRCGICRRKCPFYDQGSGRRRWRGLDAGTVQVFLEADAPRVRCDVHGVVVASVPWARHGAGHTIMFDDQIAWLATHTSKTAVTLLMRVAWRSVGAIIGRVVADERAVHDPFDGLVRIGIDEISYRRGHNYLTVVIDHDTGRLIWVAAGRSQAVLTKFFVLVGPERAAQIRFVSADAADWIANTVTACCPNALLCADPFHMVAWATKALDDLRREHWREARTGGSKAAIQELKGCRYALLKNPENLTETQHVRLAAVVKLNSVLYRAYLLKEQFRLVFQSRGQSAINQLNEWLFWARRCRIRQFVDLAASITNHQTTIENTLNHGLTNGLIESTNTKLRLITRIGYGFKNVNNLIALCLLDRGGYCPPLPARYPRI